MKKEMTKAMALDRLEALCANAERCESELRQKLWTWRIGEADSQEIMNHLRSNRFVDDGRFARSFVRDKYQLSLWGRRKIVTALMGKRIDASLIREALNEIEEDIYQSNARSVITSKLRTMSDANSYEGRTKLFRYGVGRGYEPSLVASIIKNPELWSGREC